MNKIEYYKCPDCGSEEFVQNWKNVGVRDYFALSTEDVEYSVIDEDFGRFSARLGTRLGL